MKFVDPIEELFEMKIHNNCRVPVHVRGAISGKNMKLDIWISPGQQSSDIVFGPFKDNITCHDRPEGGPGSYVTFGRRVALVCGRFLLYVEHIDDDPLHYK